jgi:hypothetical protein
MVFSASAVMAKERYGSAYNLLDGNLHGLARIAMCAMKIDYRRLKNPALIFTFWALRR